MPTERQSESARINGAKSHGPKSAEGKKKSSRNALRHGCTAGHTILLACEDRGDFKRMRKDYDAMPEPAPPEPPPAPAPTPPPAIPLTEAPVVQADSLHETKALQNEPAAQHRHRRFRSRRERKIFNASSLALNRTGIPALCKSIATLS